MRTKRAMMADAERVARYIEQHPERTTRQVARWLGHPLHIAEASCARAEAQGLITRIRPGAPWVGRGYVTRQLRRYLASCARSPFDVAARFDLEVVAVRGWVRGLLGDKAPAWAREGRAA